MPNKPKSTYCTSAPCHPWEWPTQPCTRLHIDYTGPFMGKMFLVVVDTNSKWFGVEIFPSASSSNNIAKLKTIVCHAQTSWPGVFCVAFRGFLKADGIRLVNSVASYHPAWNDLAEKYCIYLKVYLQECHQEEWHYWPATRALSLPLPLPENPT